MRLAESEYVQGKAKWCRIQTPGKYDTYYTYLYPTPESLEKIKGWKLKNHIKKDEDGYFVRFSRPVSKLIRGKVVGFAPPFMVDKHGNPMRDVLIGNGSDITCKLELYSYKTPDGKRENAVRLEGVRVDSLVPFEQKKDMEASEVEELGTVLEVPAQKIAPF